MTATTDLVIWVREDQVEDVLELLRSDRGLDPQLVRGDGAAGGGDMVAILVPLVPPALSFLAGVVVAAITRHKATIEVDGVKVTNVSRTTVEEILRARTTRDDVPE